MMQRDTNSSSESFGSCRTASDVSSQMLEVFNQAEERTSAAWTRIGLAEVDRRSKWNSFVESRLLVYINEFVHLQEAEEMSLAAENDRLFRELFFLSVRLKESPQCKMLSQLVEAALERAACASVDSCDDDQPPLRKRVIAPDVTKRSESSYAAGSRSGSPLSNKTCANVRVDEMNESFGLPSFVVATEMLAGKGGDVINSAAVSRLPRGHGDVQKRKRERCSLDSCSVPKEGSQPQDPAWAALWHLAQNMTHQTLHRTLEVEVQRMNSLADVRLGQLCFLYKQHALLQLPANEQMELRRQYAEKFLSMDFLNGETQHSPNTSLEAGHTKQGSVRSPRPTYPGVSSSECATGPDETTNPVVKDEFDLLSDSMPEQLRTSLGFPPLNCGGHNESSADIRCSSSSADNQRGEASVRRTIFTADVGDILRFGRRQDLSLDRISTEAHMIHEELLLQNTRMAAECEKEMRCIDELWAMLKGTKVAEDCEAHEEQGEEENHEGSFHRMNDSEVEVPSEQDFISRLNQLLHEYEHPEEVVSSTIVSSPDAGRQLDLEEATNQRTLPVFHSSTSNKVGSAGGSAYHLPPPLLKLFTVPSYGPVLAHVVGMREQLQRFVLQQKVCSVQRVTDELTNTYCHYYNQTQDPAYRVAPEYSQWMKEITGTAFAEGVGAGSDGNSTDGTCLWQQLLYKFKPRVNNENLREVLNEVQHVARRAEVELNSLNTRLHILSEFGPLLRRRDEILQQQRAIEEGSRERLLSRKVNMAKQLLYEENVRRQCGQELPKIYGQMEELLRRWNEEVANEGVKVNGVQSTRLLIHGVDVAAIINEFRTTAASLANARRPARSRPPTGCLKVNRANSPVPVTMSPRPPSRGVSPAPMMSPALRRQGTPLRKELVGAIKASPNLRARSQSNAGARLAAKSAGASPVRFADSVKQSINSRRPYLRDDFPVGTARSTLHKGKENR